MNILYYSKYCKTCYKLIQKLKINGLLFQLFDKIVCVDNKDNDGFVQNLPKYVTCVPVISTPDYNVPLIDNTVFDWVDYKILQIMTYRQELINNQQKMVKNTQQMNNSAQQMNTPQYTQSMNNTTQPQQVMMNPKLPPNEQEIPIMESTNNAKTAKETIDDFEKLQKQRAMDDQMLFRNNI